MKKSLLYTRTGDAGTTSLVNGTRVPKNSPRVNAYGTIDELNAHIGLLQAQTAFLDNFVNETLLRVNNLLFNIGAYLADGSEGAVPMLTDDDVTALENAIDTLDSMVPQLRQFVLPGGSVGASQAHVARTICRRAERDILTLSDSGAVVSSLVTTYINRLSDYLFILARYINHATGTPELTWQK
ncbi:MAG: cob(I)yrinic acid a,c-diamide adenosyltransferase [Muribaculaceae bacterium]|jgi:cob(I)alamin adenosyltransferase|nr:cob(I)yrinic acid a,c-diamide adenosyltransferase [Muribaculaceae bacterium]